MIKERKNKRKVQKNPVHELLMAERIVAEFENLYREDDYESEY